LNSSTPPPVKLRRGGGFFIAGFTVLEILVSVAILAILVTLAAISYEPLIARAHGARCLANMRTVHVGLANYLHDNARWPQQPETAGDEAVDDEWWIKELQPVGVAPRSWLCPAISRMGQKESWGNDGPKIHYMPSDFDSHMFSPYRYANQPWLIEIASVHSDGPNVAFPDGSIRGVYDIAPNLRKK